MASLLLCLLIRHEDALLATPLARLASAVCALPGLSTAADAQALHLEAQRVGAATPLSVRSALSAAHAASHATEAPPACLCPLLEPREIGNGAAALGAADGTTVRWWVLDLRRRADFDGARFALTRHLPPDELGRAAPRATARAEACALCREGGCGLAIVTAHDPLGADGGGGGVSAELLRLLVHELVAVDGCPRVGVLRGGFAALDAPARAALVSGGLDARPVVFDTAPADGSGGGGGGGAASKLSGARTALKNKVSKVSSFSRRRSSTGAGGAAASSTPGGGGAADF